MAQLGYTPLIHYSSGTAAAIPIAGNLNLGELALNYNDGKLFYKNSSGTVTQFTSGVTGFQTSLSGLTPSTSTTGAVTLAGTLGAISGGTSFTTYAAGDIIYSSASNTLAKLPIGSIGKVLTVSAGLLPTWAPANAGTVTSVAATVPTFLSVSGSPITASGTLAFTYSGTALPVANGGSGQTSYTDGQLLIGNTTGNTLTKTTLTAGSGISITNGAGSISIAATGSGTVTSVTGTSPVASSGGATPAISLSASYGDTQNPYASKTANFVLAAPNGSAGVPTFRAVVAADIPTLNQSTTGSAATLTTGRTIAITGDLSYTSSSFDGSANVTAAGTLATVNANVGSFTNASVTVNAKGLVTAVSSGTSGGTGTVTSVAALTLGTTGTDLSSTVATSTTTPVITLNVPTASATNRGVLSSADWTTFNSKGSGTITSVTGTAPVVSSGGTTPAISMAAATTSVSGYLTSTDWNTFNSKGSGTVTSVSGTAPVVSSGGATPAISMAAATTSVSGYLTSTDWNTFNNKGSGTVTSVAALTLGTTGTDLSSTVATGTTTPVITLNVPTASATNRGALSSADWTTFNSKGSGTVTAVSVVSNNGFAGTVATASSTPAITLTTSITGVLKGNGTAISAATVGTDYSVGTSALTTGILKSTTTTGALSIAVAADFPTLNQNTTGTANTATNIAGGSAGAILYNTASSTTTTLGIGTAYQINAVNSTSSAPSWQGLSSLIDNALTASTQGSLLYRGSALWSALGPGTSGQVLTSGGAAANPSWLPAGTGTVTSVSASVPAFLSISGSPITSSGTLAITLSGTALPVANGGTGLTSGTSGGVLAYTASGTLASSTALTASALVIGGGAGAAPSTTTTGTGVLTALGTNVGTAGAFVVNGGALGTPSSGTLTSATGLPLSTGVTGTLPVANGGTGITSLGTGVATWLGTPSSANLASAITDETGSGSLVFGTSPTLSNPTVTSYVETAYSANSATAITLLLSNGTVQIITLTGNATITMPAVVNGKSFIMFLKQDATGSRTVTWSTVKWAGGTTPTITATASKQDIYSFFSDGTNWYGVVVSQNYTP